MNFSKKYGIITASRKLLIMYLLLKFRLTFLLVLKVFDESLDEFNTEIRVKVLIYYYVPSFEIQADIFTILESI